MPEVEIRPGDCLLYHSHGPFGWFIRLKTWSDVSHVEVYVGGGKSVASRDGIGVEQYDLKKEHLSYVLRPTQPVNLADGLKWFESVRGRKYDWWGLLRFFRIGKYNNNKMFCSEFAVNFYRASGFSPFNSAFDPDQVSPGMFLSSTEFKRTYQNG